MRGAGRQVEKGESNLGVLRQKGWKLRARKPEDLTGRLGEIEGQRWGSLGSRYLQPIDVGQNVGVPESFEALEGSFGHLGLFVGTGLHIIHEDGHRTACGLGGGQRALRDVGWAAGDHSSSEMVPRADKCGEERATSGLSPGQPSDTEPGPRDPGSVRLSSLGPFARHVCTARPPPPARCPGGSAATSGGARRGGAGGAD